MYLSIFITLTLFNKKKNIYKTPDQQITIHNISVYGQCNKLAKNNSRLDLASWDKLSMELTKVQPPRRELSCLAILLASSLSSGRLSEICRMFFLLPIRFCLLCFVTSFLVYKQETYLYIASRHANGSCLLYFGACKQQQISLFICFNNIWKVKEKGQRVISLNIINL